MLKQLDYGSAISVRLIKLTGKSTAPIHPKHFLTTKPWFVEYIKEKDVVLDLGCGNGQNSLKIAKVAKKVIGIEINPKSLEIAIKTSKHLRIRNIKFILGDLEKKLPIPKKSIDKVVMLALLEHLKERNQIMEEIKKVIKPAGLLFISVPNSQTTWKKMQRSVGMSSYSDPDHKIEYSERQIKKFLSKHGFIIKQLNYGTYDTPWRGLIDIIGGFSLTMYRVMTDLRQKLVAKNPKEASGFEIIAFK